MTAPTRRPPRQPPGPSMTPFADDAASVSIGGLTVENGRDRVALYGSLDITRDAAGLAAARRLHALLAAALGVLEADGGPPDQAPPAAPTTTVRNPFG